MIAVLRRGSAVLLLFSSLAVAGQASAPVLIASTAPTPFASLMQMILGLVVVLAAIVGVAWLFRRLSGGMLAVGNRLRVVSGVMVGQREKVVIVELEGEWLVLGVTSHSVNLLSKMDKPDSAMSPPVDTLPVAEPFARWLKAAMDKSRQKSQSVSK